MSDEHAHCRSWLILGGARSGKTARALTLGAGFPQRHYIATAEAADEEMAARIDRHRAERGDAWTTTEAPLELAATISALRDAEAVAVVDCLTLWLSNLMAAGRDLEQETARLMDAIAAYPATVVLISNEVGLGIVPDNALAREFRDAQGRLNQAAAAAVERVELLAAGLAVTLKS